MINAPHTVHLVITVRTHPHTDPPPLPIEEGKPWGLPPSIGGTSVSTRTNAILAVTAAALHAAAAALDVIRALLPH